MGTCESQGSLQYLYPSPVAIGLQCFSDWCFVGIRSNTLQLNRHTLYLFYFV